MPMRTDLSLYSAIQSELLRRKHVRRLHSFGLEATDVANEMWMKLVPYTRRAPIESLGAFARLWVTRLINRLVDRESKHRRNRDPREII